MPAGKRWIKAHPLAEVWMSDQMPSEAEQRQFQAPKAQSPSYTVIKNDGRIISIAPGGIPIWAPILWFFIMIGGATGWMIYRHQIDLAGFVLFMLAPFMSGLLYVFFVGINDKERALEIRARLTLAGPTVELLDYNVTLTQQTLLAVMHLRGQVRQAGETQSHEEVCLFARSNSGKTNRYLVVTSGGRGARRWVERVSREMKVPIYRHKWVKEK